MSMHPSPIAAVLENTTRVARAGFSRATTHGRMQHVLGAECDHEGLARLLGVPGRPAGFAPLGLASVAPMQFPEGLSGGRAVRAGADRKRVPGYKPTDLETLILQAGLDLGHE